MKFSCLKSSVGNLQSKNEKITGAPNSLFPGNPAAVVKHCQYISNNVP